MWVEDLTDGGVVHRRAGNLSKGGLYLDQTIPLPIGSKVKLRFTLPEDTPPLTVTGQIVSINSRDRLGMGVKFIDVEARHPATHRQLHRTQHHAPHGRELVDRLAVDRFAIAAPAGGRCRTRTRRWPARSRTNWSMSMGLVM